MPESLVRISDHSTAFVGPDAVALFRASAVASALRLFAASGMKTTRGAGPKFLLRQAAPYLPPGRKFAANRDGCAAAAEAVDLWKENLRSALPLVDERKDAGGEKEDLDG